VFLQPFVAHCNADSPGGLPNHVIGLKDCSLRYSACSLGSNTAGSALLSLLLPADAAAQSRKSCLVLSY
jgi:hypothetical protein